MMRILWAIALLGAFTVSAQTVPLTIASSPPAGGTTIPESGTTIQVEQNKEVALTATAADFYEFSYWQIDGDAMFPDGSKITTAATTGIYCNGVTTVTAYFKKQTTTSIILVYYSKSVGRRFLSTGNGDYQLKSFPIYGFMVLDYDPNSNTVAEGRLISFWTESKQKYWKEEGISGVIDVIPQPNKRQYMYIRQFSTDGDSATGNFVTSNEMTLAKCNITGGAVPIQMATRFRGYSAYRKITSSGQEEIGALLTDMTYDEFRTKLGNQEDGGDLDATVTDLEKRLNAKGYVEID